MKFQFKKKNNENLKLINKLKEENNKIKLNADSIKTETYKRIEN